MAKPGTTKASRERAKKRKAKLPAYKFTGERVKELTRYDQVVRSELRKKARKTAIKMAKKRLKKKK